MSTTEIRREIDKTLSSLPDAALENVLTFLKQIENQKTDTIILVNNVKKVLTEDRKLLERLAK